MSSCAHCGTEMATAVALGPKRVYCSDRCRQSAYRDRRKASVVLPEFAAEPDAVADAYLNTRDSVEQLAIAVLHARTLARVFLRISCSAPPSLAWRSANVGRDLATTVDHNFPTESDAPE